jgi:hypothetical protein
MNQTALIACVLAVSFYAATAHAQTSAGRRWQVHTEADAQAWHASRVSTREFVLPAPRGNLRGDIANVARARHEADGTSPPVKDSRRARH